MKTLHIARMLRAGRGHLSFHTPGHKDTSGADITELSYSDCLLSPHGALKAAEEDIARILGADRSLILTDGSTSGVFSMVYALKREGVRTVAVPPFSHPSVFHALAIMGMKVHTMSQTCAYGIPKQPAKEDILAAAEQSDALLLTSPDYYGFCAPLAAAREIAGRQGIPLAVDGAHGSHLHFGPLHAGKYADLWVDGVHKSLPALTQGAVVSARGSWTEALCEGARIFRTTSPSYPIMASVEYAVKYPRNPAIEEAAEAFKLRHGCLVNDDWSKLVLPFGACADGARRFLESKGVYPEFQDGNYLLFYLSPCTKKRSLERLARLLKDLPRGEVGEDAPCGAIPMYTETP